MIILIIYALGLFAMLFIFLQANEWQLTHADRWDVVIIVLWPAFVLWVLYKLFYEKN